MKDMKIKPDDLVDLHMHTCASDGTLTPLELIELLKVKQIKVFSITDHDTMAAINEMHTLAEQAALCFIPGVEVSTSWDTVELHILTYGVNTEDEALIKILNENLKIREEHNRNFISYLVDRHTSVRVEDYDSYEPMLTRGGWKSLNFLLDLGVVQHMTDVFELINQMGTPMVFPSYQMLIPKLKALGYTLILAHPPAYKKGALLETSFLDELVSLGIDGIECYSPYYAEGDQESIDYYLTYCRKNDLCITSGSDAHGDFIKSRVVGKPKTTFAEIQLNHLMCQT